MTTFDRIERVFKDLNELLKDGKFTQRDLDFMEAFLERALEATRKVKERASKEEGS